MISTASSKPGSSARRAIAATAALAIAFATSHAVGGSASDASIAETLFRDGKELMKQGTYEQACPKLAESQRLDPASGTALALALCYERAGKLASAWIRYLDADALARKDGSADRSKAARARAAALEPQLAHLEIVVPEPVRATAGLQIRFDGAVVERAAWGTAMPVDSGDHAVEVTATGKLPWQATVTIGEPAEHKRVDVGPLQDAPPELADGHSSAGVQRAEPEPVPPTAAADGAGGADGAMIVGGLVLGVGLVAVGVGTFLGVRALDEIGEAQDRCPASSCADAEAVELNKSGATDADVSTALIIGGSTVAVAGLVTLLVAGLADSSATDAEPAPRAALRFGPLLGPTLGGLLLGGAW